MQTTKQCVESRQKESERARERESEREREREREREIGERVLRSSCQNRNKMPRKPDGPFWLVFGGAAPWRSIGSAPVTSRSARGPLQCWWVPIPKCPWVSPRGCEILYTDRVMWGETEIEREYGEKWESFYREKNTPFRVRNKIHWRASTSVKGLVHLWPRVYNICSTFISRVTSPSDDELWLT